MQKPAGESRFLIFPWTLFLPRHVYRGQGALGDGSFEPRVVEFDGGLEPIERAPALLEGLERLEDLEVGHEPVAVIARLLLEVALGELERLRIGLELPLVGLEGVERRADFL